MSRVLFLAYHFPPVGGAGVQRTVKFVRYLAGHGYHADVITGPGAGLDRWAPHDDTLAGELPAATEIARLPGPLPEDSGPWRSRAERWLRVPSPFARWWIEGTVELGRRFSDVELVYASMSPFESGEAAARLASELGKPWVADLRDPWALDEVTVFPTGLHRALERRRMRRVLSSAAGVVINTPEATRQVLQSFPELRAKLVATIPNGFDWADFDGPVPARTDDAFRIVHTGYLHTDLGRAHRRGARLRRLLGGTAAGVDLLTRSHVYLLEAVERLLARRPELRARLEVHLAGSLSPADVEAIRTDVVRTPGYLSHGETVALMRSADLLFLPMHDLPPGTRARIVPGKTYEYLAARRPLLAAVPDGDARDLLASFPSARLCRPADVATMEAIIEHELERGSRAPDAPKHEEALAPYERRQQAARLAALFDELLGAPAGDRAREQAETGSRPVSSAGRQ